MHIPSDPSRHLTYCLNVHPGESWAENLAAIKNKALCVRQQVCPDQLFGLGLRLGNEAAMALAVPETLKEFRRFLKDHHLYVFTVNGFPYGAFHNARVKEGVYQPDWCAPERTVYTKRLADILAALLPEGMAGSISTVPCSYKAWIRTEDKKRVMAENLTDVARHLSGIYDRTGTLIHIGLEPEPDCYLESTRDVTGFFEQFLFCDARTDLIRKHIGICFDTCHLAVQFEDLAGSLAELHGKGIRISKLQLSAAPVAFCRIAAPEQLTRFCDPVYLHQVKVRDACGGITAWPDLPEALAASRAAGGLEGEWRVHFHVPLYFTARDDIRSTSDQLTPEFFTAIRDCGIEHLEIETYTFDVLPPEMRARGVESSIVAEYEWVLARVHGIEEVGVVKPLAGGRAGSG